MLKKYTILLCFPSFSSLKKLRHFINSKSFSLIPIGELETSDHRCENCSSVTRILQMRPQFCGDFSSLFMAICNCQGMTGDKTSFKKCIFKHWNNIKCAFSACVDFDYIVLFNNIGGIILVVKHYGLIQCLCSIFSYIFSSDL